MKILVTGATGFLGGAVLEGLRAEGGHELFPLSRKSRGAANEIIADLRETALLTRLPARVDLIIHAGAYVPEREADADLDLAMRTNAEATLRLLEYSVKAGARRFVYVSSAAVYGLVSAPGGIAESAEPRPDNPYALSKLAGELMLEAYSFVHGIETVGLRFSYLYGPGMRASTVVSRFAALARAHRAIPLFNAGSDYFDLVHISDAVRAVAAAGRSGAGIFNIGSGRPTSVLELATALIAATESLSKIEPVPSDRKYHSKYLDITRAAAELPWRPTVSLREGLRGL